MRKFLPAIGTAAFVAAAAPAHAAISYTGITGAIDLDSTVLAIVAVGGTIVLVRVAVMGVRKVLSMIR